MKRPLLSVILPVYNGAQFLRDAIESILVQDYGPLEIIAVDDGSTDETANILQSYKEIEYFYQANNGVAVARNVGIKKSAGELIAFLDADDFWTPSKLSIQVEHLIKHPHVGCISGRQHNFLEPGTNKPFWIRDEHLAKDHDGFLPASVIRRCLFDQVGLFNPEFKISEDVEWYSRIKDAGIPVMVLPEIVLHRHIHNTNLSYQSKAGDLTLFKALRASLQRKQRKKSDD